MRRRWLTILACMLIASLARGQGGETGGGGGPGSGVGHNLTAIVDDAGCQPNDFVIRDGADAFFDCTSTVPVAQLSDDNANAGRCLVSGGGGVPSYQVCPGGPGTADISTMTDSGAVCALGHVVQKNPTGSPVFSCTPATGTGTITKVGPAFSSGPAFVDGTASAGTLMLVWEGTGTDNAFELNLFSPTATPTADINLTLPGATGNLVGTGDTGSVTGTMVFDNTLTDVDIGPNAIQASELDITSTKDEIEGNIDLGDIATGTLPIGKVGGGAPVANLCAQYNSSGILGAAAGACGSGSTTLDALTDVDVAGATTGTILKKSASDWIDGSLDLTNDSVIGNLAIARLGSGTNASNQTFWRGDGQWQGESNNLAVTTGIAADQIPVGTGSSVAAYKSLVPTPATNGCAGAGQALQYNTTTHQFACITGLATGSGITSIADFDGSDSQTSLTGLQFDMADGFLITSGGAGTGRIGLSLLESGIADDAVTYAKIQNVTGDNVFLGRIDGPNGIIQELTQTQATTMINTFSTSTGTSGTVPGSSGLGPNVFLNGNGGWTTPAATPGANSVGTSELNEVTESSGAPLVNELVRVNSGTTSTFEYGPCTMDDNGALSCAGDLRGSSTIINEVSSPAAPPANSLKFTASPWTPGSVPPLSVLDDGSNNYPLVMLGEGGAGPATQRLAVFSGGGTQVIGTPALSITDTISTTCDSTLVGETRFKTGSGIPAGKAGICVCAQEASGYAWRCFDQGTTTGPTADPCITLRAADITCFADDQGGIGNDGCSGLTLSGTGHAFQAASFPSDILDTTSTKSGSWNFPVPTGWANGTSIKVTIDWIGDSTACDGVATDGPDGGSVVETDNVCWSIKTAGVPAGTENGAPGSMSFVIPTFSTPAYQQQMCQAKDNLHRTQFSTYGSHGLDAGERGILTLSRVISDAVEGTANGCTAEDQYYEPAQVVGVRVCTN